MRFFVVILCLSFVSVGWSASKPNVLFIAIDDLAPALRCYGDLIAKTPHIDRLAASGVRFDRAYNQLPLCNPTRASVMTGLRPDTIKVYDLDRHFRDEVPKAVTLSQTFMRNGWWAGRVGKIYHYNVPASIGTDGFDDPPSWKQTVNPKGRDKTDEHLIFNAEPHRKISGALSWLAAEGTDEEQTDGMIATEAIKLMAVKRNDKEPFFLGVGFFRPHTPYVAPKKYFAMYPLKDMRLPYAPKGDRDDIPTAAFAHNNPVPHYSLDALTCRKALQAYYATLSFVDAQVGRLMAALERLDLADNTIVVLWSDHGYHLGEHNGIWQNARSSSNPRARRSSSAPPTPRATARPVTRIVEFVDIYPTLTDLAGLKNPKGPIALEGRSLKPLLKNPLAEWNGTAITQVLRPADKRLPKPVMGRSIRTVRWRYTDWAEGKSGVELYDHAADPMEFNNLALKPDPEAKAVMQRLRKLLEQKASGKVPTTPFNPKRL